MKITSLLASMASALVAATGASAQLMGLGGLGMGLGGMGLGGMGLGGMGGMGALGLAGMGGNNLMGMGGMGRFGGMGGLGGAGGFGGLQSMMGGIMDHEGGFEGELGLYGKGREGLKQGKEKGEGHGEGKGKGGKRGDGERGRRQENLAKMGRGGGGNWKSKFRTSVTGLGSGFDDLVGNGRQGALGVGGGLGRGGTRHTQKQDDRILERRRLMQQRRRQQMRRRQQEDEDEGFDVNVRREGVNTTPARKRKTKVPGVQRRRKVGQQVGKGKGKGVERKAPKTVSHNGSQAVRLEDLI